MDIDKKVEEIKKDFENRCEQCTYKDKYCGNEMCTFGIREWLEKEIIKNQRRDIYEIPTSYKMEW